MAKGQRLTKSELEKLTTPRLLAYYKTLRGGLGYHPFMDRYPKEWERMERESERYRKMVKSILDKREHVPKKNSKRESAKLIELMPKSIEKHIFRDTKTKRLGRMYQVSPPKSPGSYLEFEYLDGKKETIKVTQKDEKANRFIPVANR